MLAILSDLIAPYILNMTQPLPGNLVLRVSFPLAHKKKGDVANKFGSGSCYS